MRIFKLVFKNSWRHPLRTILTILGIAVALVAFGLIRTVISSWYAGVEASAKDRLVVRNAVSLVFPLPLAYRDRIAQVPGVERVGIGNWFGGFYRDQDNFFANFAVDDAYLDIYPEFQITPEERAAYAAERNACIVGRKLAERFGWQRGDNITLTGTIYQGDWEMVVRGIYTGARPNTDETALYFHWEYVNERMREQSPGFADQIGFYVVQIAGDANPAVVSEAIDTEFKNSYAESKTETETAFQQSFVSMSDTIILAMRIVSFVIVLIVLLVLANTMAMTARERISEYALLKSLGFRPFHLVGLIAGESLFIAGLGFVIGLVLLIQACAGFGKGLTQTLGSFFPVFELKNSTIFFAALASLIVGLTSAIFPTWRAVKMKIIDGLQRIG